MSEFVRERLRSFCEWRAKRYVLAPLLDAVLLTGLTVVAGYLVRQAEQSTVPFWQAQEAQWALLMGVIVTAYTALRSPLAKFAHAHDSEPCVEVLMMAHEELYALGSLRRRRTFRGVQSYSKGASEDERVKALREMHSPNEVIAKLMILLQVTVNQEFNPGRRQRSSARVDLVSIEGEKVTGFICSVPDAPEPALSPEDLSRPNSGFSYCVGTRKHRSWGDVTKAVLAGELVDSPEFRDHGGGSLLCVPLSAKNGEPPIGAIGVFIPRKGCITKRSERRLIWLVNRVQDRIITQMLLKSALEERR